jgi:ferredoxin
MKTPHGRLLVCDCERSMHVDIRRIADALGVPPPALQTRLCTAQTPNFLHAVASGDPVTVCCTQEAPLFADLALEQSAEARLRFVNIRERAGWSEEGSESTAKMAALIAEATVAIEPTPAQTLSSAGVALVYGSGALALDAARRLSSRLTVTCLLQDVDDAQPPNTMNVGLFGGRVRGARGHLGAFEVTVDRFAEYVPSSRGAIVFGGARDGIASHCDLIVDLSGGQPMFPAHDKREGYFRAEPSNLAGVERALFEASDMTGDFEKPRYVRLEPSICAHSRNQIVGCSNCLDVCPTGAIVAAGDHVAIDPFICAGHGACASVCPTGAIRFDLPGANALFERARVLSRTYFHAGGRTLRLLIHDMSFGDELIAASARSGRGLPADVVPFAVHEVFSVGIDFLLTAMSYGAAQVRILPPPGSDAALDPLRQQVAIVRTILSAMGYGEDRVVIDEVIDPDGLEAALYAASPATMPARSAHLVMGNKRETLRAALDHLHREAPSPVEAIALPAGAPFGAILLNQERCTLCLACVGVCPVSALGDDPQRPLLSFTEVNCVQCGLCRATCPEDAIELAPRLRFAADARETRVLKTEEPFACVRCGKPFGARTTIEALVDRLSGHSMFGTPERLELLKMCEDCRIAAQFQDAAAPFASASRPRVRTTDDYLPGGSAHRVTRPPPRKDN